MNKKLFYVFVACLTLLVACSTSVSIDQTFDVPDTVQAAIQPESELQLIKKGLKGYIVLHTTETLTLTEIEAINGVVTVNFNTEDEGNTKLNQYVFELNPGNARIEVSSNGKVTAFEPVTDL